MADGLFWPIPITLSASMGLAEPLRIGQSIAFTDPDDGSVLATM